MTVRSYRGSQRSPFQHPSDGRYYGYSSGNANIYVTRKRDGAKFQFGNLLIDLIRHNGFFEGRGIEPAYAGFDTFRVDPHRVMEFFNIRPGVDYSIGRDRILVWGEGGSDNHGPVDFTWQLRAIQFPGLPVTGHVVWWDRFDTIVGGESLTETVEKTVGPRRFAQTMEAIERFQRSGEVGGADPTDPITLQLMARETTEFPPCRVLGHELAVRGKLYQGRHYLRLQNRITVTHVSQEIGRLSGP